MKNHPSTFRLMAGLSLVLACLFGAQFITQSAPLSEGLYGYWPLNEGTGTALNDLSGIHAPGVVKQNNGAIPIGIGTGGGVWTNDPVRGNVLAFSGEDAQAYAFLGAQVIPVMTLNPGDVFTWSFWAKSDQAISADIILGNRYATNPPATDFAPLEFIKFSAQLFDWNYTNQPNQIIAFNRFGVQTEWMHHVVVKDGATFTYYRNGVLQPQSLTATTAPTHKQPLCVGGQGIENWRGYAGQVALWTNALTADKVADLYQLGLGNGSVVETFQITNLVPKSVSFVATNVTITFSVDKTTSSSSPVPSGNIQLTINGAAVTSTITDGGAQWNVSHTASLQPNQYYTILATATANDGKTSSRASKIDTFSLSNFTFEAEDFNFEAGQYINNPVVSLSDTNSYYQRGAGAGVEGVDFHESTPSIHLGFGGVEWRFDGINAFASLPQTTNTFDQVRPAYVTAGIADYDLANNAVGEWGNYTRSYPAGNYNLYARVASAGAFDIRVDLVSGDITTTNQTLSKRGRFTGAGNSTLGIYTMVPMTDDTGTNVLTVSFDGSAKTLRLTALSAAFLPNFCMLIPSQSSQHLIPVVAISSPANFSSLPVGATPTINASVTDPDSGSHTVKFYVDGQFVGQDTTAPYSFTNASLSNGRHTLSATATDPDGVTGSASALVQVGPEEFLYRETFTCPAAGVGDKFYNSFGWQVFGITGQAMNDNPGGAGWVNQGTAARTNDINTFSAGTHFDGTFDPSPRGTAFFGDTGTQTPSLSFTPEFSFNPADYPAGQLKFSWYQGNANTAASLRLIIRIGSTWYAHATAFTNTAAVALNQFVTTAQLKQLIYDPAASNWRVLNFDGDYNHLTKVAQNSTLGTLSVGAQPAQPLSGTITAFGIMGEQLPNGTGNRRFDAFTIDTKVLNITGWSTSGGFLSLVGSGGTTGNGYRVLNATDVALPVAQWTQAASGTFGTGGVFSNAVPVNPNEPGRYYRIVTP